MNPGDDTIDVRDLPTGSDMEECDKELAEQFAQMGYDDWEEVSDNMDCIMIHDDYFEQYAKELAEDCGMIDKDAGWPMRCIDWEEAADQLREDYAEVEYQGHVYWIHS